jgi:ATP-dependent DNA ligase
MKSRDEFEGFCPRFPLVVEALSRLKARSCIIDGGGVACGEDGIALFERIRYRRHDATAFMWAFGLIELNGEDLRREQLEDRKAALARLLGRVAPGELAPVGRTSRKPFAAKNKLGQADPTNRPCSPLFEPLSTFWRSKSGLRP